MAAGANVAFFVQHDLIDQAADLGIPTRYPRHLDAGEPSLKRLQQRQEVPDRKYVYFHEETHRADARQSLIHVMPEQPLLEVVDIQAIRHGGENSSAPNGGLTWEEVRRLVGSCSMTTPR